MNPFVVFLSCYASAFALLTIMVIYIKYPRIVKACKYLGRLSVSASKLAAETAMMMGIFLIPIIVSIICYLN